MEIVRGRIDVLWLDLYIVRPDRAALNVIVVVPFHMASTVFRPGTIKDIILNVDLNVAEVAR